MKKKMLLHDALVMAGALCGAYAMVLLTQVVMGRIDGVAMLVLCWQYLSRRCIQRVTSGARRRRSSACWR